MLTVDDDPAVSRAVARDLRRHYGERLPHRAGRVGPRRAGHPQGTQAARRDRRHAGRRLPDAADERHRVPRRRRWTCIPLAKRVLLTAYADTHAAIDAINVVDLDHYLLKPWDPPRGEALPRHRRAARGVERPRRAGHPVHQGHRPPLERSDRGRFASSWPATGCPSTWFVADEPKGKQLLDAAGLDGKRLPVVITEKGDPLVEPTDAELADMLGLSTEPSQTVRPRRGRRRARRPGLRGVRRLRGTARRCSSRSTTTGGQAGRSSRIENYLGFPTGCPASRAGHSRPPAGGAVRRRGHHHPQRRRAGGRRIQRTVEFEDGSTIGARSVILATGVAYNQLDGRLGMRPDAATTSAAACYYGASVSDRRGMRGRGGLHRRRRELGGPGRDVSCPGRRNR